MRSLSRIIVLLALVGGAGASLGAEPATMSDDAAKAKAQAWLDALPPVKGPVKADQPRVLQPVGSLVSVLPQWKLASPLPGYKLFCVTLAYTTARPVREFLAVGGDGTVIAPFDAGKAAELFTAADKAKWTERDYFNAAFLCVHLMDLANQDGWIVLDKPEDFTAIKHNMDSVGPGLEKQAEAAKKIQACKVVYVGKDGQVVVTFYAWHNIGGYLRRWEVSFDKTLSVTKGELGQFGGGGYD